jgi:trehalose utilization protein
LAFVAEKADYLSEVGEGRVPFSDIVVSWFEEPVIFRRSARPATGCSNVDSFKPGKNMTIRAHKEKT